MDLTISKPTVFLATADAKAARRFYSKTLGLPLQLDDKYALVYALRGAELRLSKIPVHKPLPFTVLDLEVDDIDDAYQQLASRGVEFVIFENMVQDIRGVWASDDGEAKILWFKDPDGNVLSVSQRA